MASTYEAAITLVDTKNLKTTLRWKGIFSGVDAAAEFASATAAIAALQSALEAVTDANVYKTTLTLLVDGGTALPADADITDEAAVVCFLTAAGVAPEYHVLRIPAPISALFESDGVTVDETNAALQSYVDEFDQPDVGFQVSDGEYIDTTNENGISHGYWRSRAKSTA